MKKFLFTLALLFALGLNVTQLAAQTGGGGGGAATNTCDPCASVPWSSVMTHQFYFTPPGYPGCMWYGEIWYKYKNCNGQIEYEIIHETSTPVSGPCNFSFCGNWGFKDLFEKEMIITVFGGTNVIRSIPVACWREVELDMHSDPGYIDCATHHGMLPPFSGNPVTTVPCDPSCCIAQAEVQYQGGLPVIHWVPLSSPVCSDTLPIPSVVTVTVCCETVINSFGEEVCVNWQTFNLTVVDTGDCHTFCSGMLFFKGMATGINDAKAIIGDNIKFQQGTKVFPNPSDGKISISTVLPSNQPVIVEVIDIKGQLVKSYTLAYETSQKEYPYDISELKAGYYFVKLTTKDYGNKIIRINKQ